MKKLNFNSIVKVKLTELGKDVYYHQFDDLIKQGINITPTYPEVDSEGFTEFQLWVFMNLYGPYIYMAANKVVDDLNFYIDDMNIGEVDYGFQNN